jgi:hypothetical protein
LWVSPARISQRTVGADDDAPKNEQIHQRADERCEVGVDILDAGLGEIAVSAANAADRIARNCQALVYADLCAQA